MVKRNTMMQKDKQKLDFDIKKLMFEYNTYEEFIKPALNLYEKYKSKMSFNIFRYTVLLKAESKFPEFYDYNELTINLNSVNPFSLVLNQHRNDSRFSNIVIKNYYEHNQYELLEKLYYHQLKKINQTDNIDLIKLFGDIVMRKPEPIFRDKLTNGKTY